MKRLILTIIIISLMNMALFASYDEALNLYQEKKYTESLKVLADELIIENDLKPESPNYKIRYLAAHVHWKLGNSKSAITHFTRCMDIAKDKADPYIDLSLYQIELKKYRDALNTIRRGMEVKKAPMLFYNLGKIALIKKNYWRAKDLFEKANSLDPELYISYHDLGVVLMNLKKYSQANTAFTVALEMSPESLEILNNIGLSLEMLGKYKEAYRYYEEAISIDSENKAILENLKRVEEKK